jgi:formylglycine-generating enzyme required for sulfatase activity
MKMVYVPGGTFEMGSADDDPNAGEDEKPQHEVTLDAFWIDKYEVSNAQYTRCVEAGACQASGFADDTTYNGADYPVVGVSWEDAAVYCEWVNGQLPTEAEWEYAARGPDSLIYTWGNDPPDDSLLNYDYNVSVPAQVGSYPEGASWADALDMAGNVWEWVNDWYGRDYYASSPPLAPKGPETGETKVLRGGGWNNSGEYVRAAFRYSNLLGSRYDTTGFRCVVEPGN